MPKNDEVRVLIVGLPHFLQELFEKAFAEHSYTLVSARDGLEQLAKSVETEQPDYVVVPLEGGELPAACRELLAARGRVKLLGVEERYGHARLIRLLPSVREFEDAAPHELVARIEEVAADAATR
jgi:DNA-binding response OmpR family regulator